MCVNDGSIVLGVKYSEWMTGSEIGLLKLRRAGPPYWIKFIFTQAIEETAKYFKVQPIVMEGVAHDCMLDTRWASELSCGPAPRLHF